MTWACDSPGIKLGDVFLRNSIKNLCTPNTIKPMAVIQPSGQSLVLMRHSTKNTINILNVIINLCRVDLEYGGWRPVRKRHSPREVRRASVIISDKETADPSDGVCEDQWRD